jgi:amino-acid N-acetyltransferase
VLRGVMSETGLVIRAARDRDLEQIERLLVAESLPLDGVAEALPGFLVAEENESIVGAVAIESCGEYGLLRSAAVHGTARNRGIGRQLVERAIDSARKNDVRGLYLLTTTAENYFPQFGFEVTDREDAPDSIRQTTEFTTACPASATLMKLDVR